MRKFRFALRLSLPGLICLTLVACMQPGQQAVTPAKPAAVRPPEPDLIEKSRAPVTTAAAPNASPRQRPSDAERQRKPEQPALQPGAAQAKADFSSLIGRSFDGVERLLGPADQTTDVPPGREWLYRDGPCTLVVRFYPDMKTLAFRVLSYVIEDGDGTSETANSPTTAPNANGAQDTQCRTRLAARFKSER